MNRHQAAAESTHQYIKVETLSLPHLSHGIGIGHEAGLTAVRKTSYMTQLMPCNLWVFGEVWEIHEIKRPHLMPLKILVIVHTS